MSFQACCSTDDPCERHARAQHQEVIPAQPRNEAYADLFCQKVKAESTMEEEV
jgi:hypothetical protein